MQKSWAVPRDSDALVAAFPSRLAAEVRGAISVLPASAFPPVEPFAVDVRGERVTIPSRIYSDEPHSGAEGSLSGTEQLILRCLYSRHGDGRIRQRHLERILESDEPWVAPFVVRLAGEYVVEILEAIHRGLPGLDVPGSAQRRLYGEFISRNPSFFARTERRVVSYWSCYYRWKYPVFGTYPGSALVEAFRSAAAEQGAVLEPRHTPRPLSARDPLGR
ncbi:hypothetical protein ACFC1B_17930 [Streptomyces xiamenensis]|uniref:hypothetical protein n=1 Tax=Streptomyces xiamenensis TaxID=408015 RepID=UPI000D14AF16|nr:hypothetical protein [Streptomyces xiamenensis]